MKFFLKTFIVFMAYACIGLLISCTKKPIAPEIKQIYKNMLNVSYSDTTIGITSYYKISFSKNLPTWDPQYVNQPSLNRFYRKAGNSMMELLKNDQGFFLPNTSDTSQTLVYLDESSKLDTLRVLRSAFFLNKVDSHVVSAVTYFAVALTGLSSAAPYADYTGGFCGDTAHSPAVTGRLLTGFSINDGAQTTADNNVTISTIFDTASVKKIIIYNYSAFNPISSPDTIPILLNGIKYEQRIGNNWATKPDTLVLNEDSLKNHFSNVVFIRSIGKVSITWQMKLLQFYGKKWVAMQRLGANNNNIGPLLYDDIDIQSYNVLVSLDTSDKSRFSFDETVTDKKICVLSDNIPVFINTFGDTTFNDTVEIWIATRKNSSYFYPEVVGAFGTSDSWYTYHGLKWPDCIYETKPEIAFFNNVNEVRAEMSFDFESGYRISPLATPFLTDNGLTLSYIMPNLLREDINKSLISLVVTPGSILGYSKDSLNTFNKQNLLGYNSESNIVSVTDSGAPGWFETISFNDVMNAGSLNAYLGPKANRTHSNSAVAGFSLDPDGRLYQHPFRGLPITSSTVNNGVKEFVIIMYGKGKYFNEPRVAISKYNTVYRYVWDKIPPQFIWSITEDRNAAAKWEPADKEYAPMCYFDPLNPWNNKCTDLSKLFGTFDVYLSQLGNAYSRTAVRDKGFGRINSVKLLFNYHDNYLKSDPFTGERSYITANIVYELPEDFIHNQGKKTYYNDDGSTAGSSYAISGVVFKDINYSGWQSGLWDMWVETSDDLGNRGLAPHGIVDLSGAKGFSSIRQVEIK